MKVGILLSSLALTAAVAGIAAPASAVDHRPVGRWDITIGLGKARIPSWIEIRPPLPVRRRIGPMLIAGASLLGRTERVSQFAKVRIFAVDLGIFRQGADR